MMGYLGGPGFLSPRTTLGADISLLFAVAFISIFLYAGSLARRKKGLAHHRTILTGFILMVAYLAYYIQVRYLGFASAMDQVSFPGPPWVYAKILRPLLLAHVVIVCVSLYLSVYMVINGFMTKFPLDDGSITLKTGIAQPSKVLWGIGFLWLAFLFYMFLPHPRLNLWHKGLILILGFVLPASVSMVIHRTLPKADRRHRVMGRITLLFFSLMLVTTCATYFLIYIAKY